MAMNKTVALLALAGMVSAGTQAGELKAKTKLADATKGSTCDMCGAALTIRVLHFHDECALRVL